MPNVPTRLILFLSSYAPLFAILAIRNSFQNRYVSIALAALTVVSVAVLFIFVHYASALQHDRVLISSVLSRDGDAMSYIVTYLLPFLAVRFNEVADAISLGIALAVIGILYVNSNMIYTNPVLNIAGYHIFDVEYSGGKRGALICRRSYIRAGTELDVVPLGDYVLMEKH